MHKSAVTASKLAAAACIVLAWTIALGAPTASAPASKPAPPAGKSAPAPAKSSAAPAGPTSQPCGQNTVSTMWGGYTPVGPHWGCTATNSPNYARASAHTPMFDDRTLWPGLSGKEAFIKQQWPAVKVLVWAHPGETGRYHPKRIGLDPCDPKNWIEYPSAADADAKTNGKPCDKLELNDHVDLLFPASAKSYVVGFRGSPMNERCRHLTIEPGAGFVGGGDGQGRYIAGNVWVKRGGVMGGQNVTLFMGGGNVFFRNDNPGPQGCAHYFTFAKEAASTIEILGHITMGDEFSVNACTLIIGPDSAMQPGRASHPFIDKDGKLVLMDGAYFGNWANNFDTPDMVIKKGTIQGGTSERPLTRSARFGLGVKDFTQAAYKGGPKGDKAFPRVPSLVVGAGCSLQSCSTDAAKAHLVFEFMGEDEPTCGIGHDNGYKTMQDRLAKGPDEAAEAKWYDSLPRGVDAWIAADATIDSVEFDGFRKGGLMLPDLSAMTKWKGVIYGPNNLAKGQELFSKMDKLNRNQGY